MEPKLSPASYVELSGVLSLGTTAFNVIFPSSEHLPNDACREIVLKVNSEGTQR